MRARAARTRRCLDRQAGVWTGVVDQRWQCRKREGTFAGLVVGRAGQGGAGAPSCPPIPATHAQDSQRTTITWSTPPREQRLTTDRPPAAALCPRHRKAAQAQQTNSARRRLSDLSRATTISPLSTTSALHATAIPLNRHPGFSLQQWPPKPRLSLPPSTRRPSRPSAAPSAATRSRSTCSTARMCRSSRTDTFCSTPTLRRKCSQNSPDRRKFSVLSHLCVPGEPESIATDHYAVPSSRSSWSSSARRSATT